MLVILGNIGPWELILILAIALIIFGPGKLPEAGKALGRAIGEFRKASSGLEDEVKHSRDAYVAPPSAPEHESTND